MLTYPICIFFLAGAGSSKGVQDLTACSRPHLHWSPGAEAEHPLCGTLLPSQLLPASSGEGWAGEMGSAASLSSSCSRSPK